MSNELVKDPFLNATDRVQTPVHPKPARDAWTDTDLSRIAIQARQAYEQKRLKNCLNLTMVLLEADPANEEAQALESVVRTAIGIDLEHARALMQDVQFADSPQVFGRGAEIILRRVLNIDPEEAEAKALLTELQGMIPTRPAAPQTISASVEVPAAPAAEPESTWAPFTVISPDKSEPEAPPQTKFLQTRLTWIFLCALVVLAPFFLFRGRSGVQKTQYGAHPADASVHPAIPIVANNDAVQSSRAADTVQFAEIRDRKPNSEPKDLGFRSPVPEKVLPDPLPRPSNIQPEKPKPAADAGVKPTNAAPVKPPAASPADRSAPKQPAAAAPNETGTFAVNSRVPTDIYMSDKYLGSTPTTLELPAGANTLEYRYENLRKVVTEAIKPGETKTSTISFEVTVEINARPWAQVSIAGVENRPLGQTPLSNITVPVGSTLVFENPNFAKKNYRVTGKDTAIRVVFP